MALRLGIIGTAAINDLILRGAALTDRVDVVAVASRDPGRAAAYARAHDIPLSLGSYEELLARDDVDAVYVPLPNSLHVDWSVRALQAGKHVLCEKPLTPDPVEAEHAVDAAARAGRVLMEGFMYRHNPQTVRLADVVRSGAIGRLLVIRSSLRFPVSDPANIRLSAPLAGGSVMDLGCYCINVIRLLAGEPERVYGEQLVGATGVEVTFVGTMSFASDVLAQFDSSFAAPVWQELEVVGANGSARVSAPFRIDWGRPGIELRRGDTVEVIEVEERDSYALELDDFAAATIGGEAVVSAADSIGQARAIGALYASAAQHVPIVL